MMKKLPDMQRLLCRVHINGQRPRPTPILIHKSPDTLALACLTVLAHAPLLGSEHRSETHPDSRAIFYDSVLYDKFRIKSFSRVLVGFETMMNIVKQLQEKEVQLAVAEASEREGEYRPKSLLLQLVCTCPCWHRTKQISTSSQYAVAVRVWPLPRLICLQVSVGRGFPDYTEQLDFFSKAFDRAQVIASEIHNVNRELN